MIIFVLMVKKKIEVKMYSYGEYSQWDRQSKLIPRLLDITDVIEAELGTEFGYVLRIKGAKGKKIDFCIDHPSFCDDKGEVMPSFTGEVIINSNDYEFFLGDCIWAPIGDKMGTWVMTTKIEGCVFAKKALKLVVKAQKKGNR
jgi:hypothetical protein